MAVNPKMESGYADADMDVAGSDKRKRESLNHLQTIAKLTNVWSTLQRTKNA